MTRIIEDIKLDFRDVLLTPKRSELASRSEVNLMRKYKFKHSSHTVEIIGILAANMDHTGTFEMAKALGKDGLGIALHKFYTVKELFDYFKVDPLPNNCTFYSMGITDDDYKKFWELVEMMNGKTPKMVCIDVANGYSRKFVAFVEKMRETFPNLVIMAGNVVTPDMTYDLLERGADIVKIGIGSGSVCTTRKITGVGYPQLSAIMECADAAHGANGLICGDGGITEPGDIAKAFAGGADFVMAGGLFAGHQECSGEIKGKKKDRDQFEIKVADRYDPILNEQFCYEEIRHKESGKLQCRKSRRNPLAGGGNVLELIETDPTPIEFFEDPVTMKFYGMSSQEAMDKHYGGKADYRASEGKAVEVPYKGSVTNTIEEILGGLRSACTYVGASTLKQLSKCATYVRVNRILNDKFGEQQ